MSTLKERANAIVLSARMEPSNTVRRSLDQMDAGELRDLVVYLARRAPVAITHGENQDSIADLVAAAVADAAQRFNVTPESVLSTSRAREDVEARQVVAYALRLAVGLSYPALGRHLGRDHTSVMHATAKVGETPRLRRIATQIAVHLGWTRDCDDIEEEAS